MRSKRVVALLAGLITVTSVVSGCNLRVATAGTRCAKLGEYAQDRTFVLKCNKKKRWERGITVALADQALSALLAQLSRSPAGRPTATPANSGQSVALGQPVTTFGNVTEAAVGQQTGQIRPGVYTTTARPGSFCTWARYDATGNDPVGNEAFRGLGFMQIRPTDQVITTQGGCTWAPAPDAPQPVPASGEGMLRVGTEIQPGLYRRVADGNPCFWLTSQSLDGSQAAELDSALSRGPQLVSINSKAKLFESFGCGTWTRLDATPNRFLSLESLDISNSFNDSFTWLPADGPYSAVGTTAGIDVSANGWTVRLRPPVGTKLAPNLVVPTTGEVGSEDATHGALSITGGNRTCTVVAGSPLLPTGFQVEDVGFDALGNVTSFEGAFNQNCSDGGTRGFIKF